ncbi:hypothetical protein, partial [Rhodoplanes roseus]|uniref:hypothetical protein n=1 Tax=Rhodoplanes roseus TaxID=29409 RepID=UPI001AECB6FA
PAPGRAGRPDFNALRRDHGRVIGMPAVVGATAPNVPNQGLPAGRSDGKVARGAVGWSVIREPAAGLLVAFALP